MVEKDKGNELPQLTKRNIKGKELPKYVEGVKGNFRFPYGLELDIQQKILTNAL